MHFKSISQCKKISQKNPGCTSRYSMFWNIRFGTVGAAPDLLGLIFLNDTLLTNGLCWNFDTSIWVPVHHKIGWLHYVDWPSLPFYLMYNQQLMYLLIYGTEILFVVRDIRWDCNKRNGNKYTGHEMLDLFEPRTGACWS
jgi:hypothetical protein